MRVYQTGDVRYTRNRGYHWQDDPFSVLCFRVVEVITEVAQASDDGGVSWQDIKQTTVRIRFQDCGRGRENEEASYPFDAEMLKDSWSISEAQQTQRELCEKNRYPHFAPYSGVCMCGKNIYTRHDGKGYITGCPHCGKSYCD